MLQNKVILIGRLGKDPEILHLDSGVVKASFSLATDESYKDKEQKKVSKVNWHNVVCWRGLAEVAEKWLKKGSEIVLEGSIQYRSYEDKEGQKKFITEILADTFKMIGGKAAEKPEKEAEQSDKAPEDDLPF